MPEPTPLLLSRKQTRQMLGGIAETTYYELVRKGHLHPVKLGRAVRIRYEEVERLARDGVETLTAGEK